MDFITLVTVIVVAVLAPLASMGVHWLGARAGELIQAKVRNERLRAALLRLDDAVVTAVKDLEQTLVPELRALAADGKLSGQDRRRLKETAIRHVKAYLGSAGLDELSKVLDLLGVDDFIGSRVEATVLDMKRAVAGGPPGRSAISEVTP